MDAESIEIYGPYWQAECKECGWLGDVEDTPSEAKQAGIEHDCLRAKFPFGIPEWMLPYIKDKYKTHKSVELTVKKVAKKCHPKN